MQDRELYRRILGIEAPWRVDHVELQLEAGEIHIHLEHEQSEWRCADGDIWIPVSTERSCMRSYPEPIVPIMVREASR
jgi:hypothetical protein